MSQSAGYKFMGPHTNKLVSYDFQPAYQFFTKDGPLALLPVNNQRCSFVWSLKDNSEILEYTK